MCIKKTARLVVWSLVPGATGLFLGGISSYSLTVFIGILVLVVGVLAYWLGAQYRHAGRGTHLADCPQVQTSAGVLLALSFQMGFWAGLAWSAGHGLFADVLAFTVATGLLAAFFLTVVKSVVDGKYPALTGLLDRVFPDRRGDASVQSTTPEGKEV